MLEGIGDLKLKEAQGRILSDKTFSSERSFQVGRAGRCSDFWLQTYASPSPLMRVGIA
jgi:hypothetical protein